MREHISLPQHFSMEGQNDAVWRTKKWMGEIHRDVSRIGTRTWPRFIDKQIHSNHVYHQRQNVQTPPHTHTQTISLLQFFPLRQMRRFLWEVVTWTGSLCSQWKNSSARHLGRSWGHSKQGHYNIVRSVLQWCTQWSDLLADDNVRLLYVTKNLHHKVNSCKLLFFVFGKSQTRT